MGRHKLNLEIMEGEEYSKGSIPKSEPQKTTNTAFILMFPAVILAAIATFYAPLGISLIALALVIYQFLMLKKFIEDYYKVR